MGTLFPNDSQQRFMDILLAELGRVGYRGDLVEKEYKYPERFERGKPERKVDAALFGRTPADFDTALFGMVGVNGVRGAELVNSHRSLGAPLVLEIQDTEVGVWTVGREKTSTKQLHRFDEVGFRLWLSEHQAALRPNTFLRSKELKGGPDFIQGSLFAGLIPELEDEINRSLGPILQGAFEVGKDTYHQTTGLLPQERQLFKLGFWLLTGKVFSDRRHPKFVDLLGSSDPDAVLDRVAAHYSYAGNAQELLNRNTREAVFDRIWGRMDFRNLSVEVLSQIWSRTLVSPETRKRLGIHRTRKSVVRELVGSIPFGDFAREDRRVLEPCSGNAAFLIGAIDRMRDIDDISDPEARHDYFKRILRGVEFDPFGVEISRLCLALADYPNPNGWKIEEGDIFHPEPLSKMLAEARIVLCNPPFEKFSAEERHTYQAKFWFKPAELLARVLHGLHRDGVIGFVLPRAFLDGRDYRETRSLLVKRFDKLDLVSLPDKAWDTADLETVLLTATKPRQGDRSTVSHAIVKEQDWRAFDWFHQVSSRDSDTVTAEEARKRLSVPELREIWEHLAGSPTLGDFIEPPRRGIEWNVPLKTHRDILVRGEDFEESRLGIPPLATITPFQRPETRYLNFSKKYRRRNSFDLPWDRPKVMMQKARRSRGMWRVAAFADFEGLACYQTFIAVWPNQPELIVPIAAVLNGPVANAYLAVHSKESFNHKDIKFVPFPYLSKEKIDEIGCLVARYQEIVEAPWAPPEQVRIADGLLRQLDATILESYGLTPRLERLLLDSFNGGKRPVRFHFADYFPADFESYISLSVYISEEQERATGEDFMSNAPRVTDPQISDALSDLE